MIDDEDWVIRMCDALDRWSQGKRAAVVLGVISGCIFAVWVARADERTQDNRRALHEHIQWLNRMPDTEKKHWPVESICRPGPEDPCRCYDYFDRANYVEVLPNGDVACHQTR